MSTLFLHLETQSINDKIIKKRMLYALLFNYYWSLNMIGCFYFLFNFTMLYSIQTLMPQLVSGKKIQFLLHFIATHMMILLHIIITDDSRIYNTYFMEKTLNLFVFLQLERGIEEKYESFY